MILMGKEWGWFRLFPYISIQKILGGSKNCSFARKLQLSKPCLLLQGAGHSCVIFRLKMLTYREYAVLFSQKSLAIEQNLYFLEPPS